MSWFRSVRDVREHLYRLGDNKPIELLVEPEELVAIMHDSETRCYAPITNSVRSFDYVIISGTVVRPRRHG
jgi:hypothetical protein